MFWLSNNFDLWQPNPGQDKNVQFIIPGGNLHFEEGETKVFLGIRLETFLSETGLVCQVSMTNFLAPECFQLSRPQSPRNSAQKN